MVCAAPEFDPAQAPADPLALFIEWLLHAIDGGVTEPHAMTVSTVSGSRPSARVLILKDVDENGWHFAVSAISRKGAELARNPAVTLTFYWPAVGRQIRIEGTARADPPRVTADDFLARSDAAQAMALTGRQSEPYCDPAEVSEALAKARIELDQSPGLVPADWVSYAVRADTVEFWQSDPGRRHQRLRYERDGASWSTTLLWP
ncbi:pyridoxine/pyridoxamine 5'-phosphate oxidase [[Mycobacterium] nativiensis]|uniref:Pyridoxal 5'-phosphate synthase n=1 Tax=[Mycobacterium] nativiensis TaxID=2855503 RepID=A0ABU5Y2Z5_9MYCO|nr:pyridoxal 5'-phosphate synthase [Mycolicibacter sp. MYC340]MEB3034604.1 pyridoxal 5'-phosphate synthase [Mycolicibacter sp. MYC340]